MNWTPCTDRFLLQLMTQAASASAVVKAMAEAGFEVTRNMVIGRSYRLKRMGVDVPRPERPSGASKPRPQKKPVVGGINYFELQPGQCKAVLDKLGSDGLPMVCGKPQGEDWRGQPSSYCAAHIDRYYTRPQPQVRTTARR